jgi:hypothetical protein
MKPEYFHMRLRPFLQIGLLCGSATLIAIIGFQLIWDNITGGKATLYALRNSPAMHWILVFAIIQFWSAVLIVTLVRISSYRVGPDGIRSWTISGWPVLIKWSDPIERIELKKLCGVPYVMIHGVNARRFILPIYDWTARPRRFERLIALHAGPDHALVMWMNQHWHPTETE